METKFTKGKWVFDKNKNAITNESVSGLLATAWCTYKSDEIEQRQDGESWLSMRERTKSIRDEKEIEQQANALLISKAPLLFADLLDIVWLVERGAAYEEIQERIKTSKQLLKEATEL